MVSVAGCDVACAAPGARNAPVPLPVPIVVAPAMIPLPPSLPLLTLTDPLPVPDPLCIGYDKLPAFNCRSTEVGILAR